MHYLHRHTDRDMQCAVELTRAAQRLLFSILERTVIGISEGRCGEVVLIDDIEVSVHNDEGLDVEGRKSVEKVYQP